jgi:predicted RNA binding protein YcfA (HicA-like mRNA interferase family)
VIDCHWLQVSRIKQRENLGPKTMKVRDVIKRLKADGWYLARTRGSHRQFKHPTRSGLVTVSGKLNVDLPPKTLKSIWRQAQWQ